MGFLDINMHKEEKKKEILFNIFWGVRILMCNCLSNESYTIVILNDLFGQNLYDLF